MTLITLLLNGFMCPQLLFFVLFFFLNKNIGCEEIKLSVIFRCCSCFGPVISDISENVIKRTEHIFCHVLCLFPPLGDHKGAVPISLCCVPYVTLK